MKLAAWGHHVPDSMSAVFQIKFRASTNFAVMLVVMLVPFNGYNNIAFWNCFRPHQTTTEFRYTYVTYKSVPVGNRAQTFDARLVGLCTLILGGAKFNTRSVRGFMEKYCPQVLMRLDP